uniref:Uncharacterized protein n=1 Tax=Leptobrachium leishanense TaxID=445787 RepID=A0A8C5MB31_9ANUR
MKIDFWHELLLRPFFFFGICVIYIFLFSFKQITSSDEADILYKKIEVLAKCHDKAVLDSLEYFAVLAAQQLGLTLERV